MAWAQVESEAARDVSEKTASPPMHRVSFLVEEDHYLDFCEKATEHNLSPSEVARRYCLSGYTFASLIWGTVRRGADDRRLGEGVGRTTESRAARVAELLGEGSGRTAVRFRSG